MMTRYTTGVLAVVSFLLLGAAPAAPGWLDHMGLTPGQKSKIEAIHTKRATEVESLRAEKQRLADELKKAMLGSASDDEVRALHGRFVDVKRKLGDGHLQSLLEIRALLTPAQRAEFVEHMDLRGGPPGCGDAKPE